MRFDAVIFDLDGTLLDTEALALGAAASAFAAHGLPAKTAFLHSLIGKDSLAVAAAISLEFDGLGAVEPLLADISAHFQAAAADGIPLKPGVSALLDHLDDLALPRAVATNSRHASAMNSLERAGIADRFGAVVGFDLVAAPKPAPDVYRHAAGLIGAKATRTIVFEDSDLGALAAKRAGMFVVQVPDIVAPQGDHADILAEDLLTGARLARLIPFPAG